MTFKSSFLFCARSAVIIFFAVALTLTACGTVVQPEGGPSSSPLPSPSSASATPTPSPTPSGAYRPADSTGKAENVPLPVLPEAAKANTKEGLEAFARYWFQALSYGYETGDMTALKQVTGPNCVFCNGLQEAVGLAWADGKWIVGGQIETPVIEGKFTSGAESQQATIQVIHRSVAIHQPGGSLYQEPTKGSNRASQMVAKFGANGWTVIDLGLIR
ncbi:DUF6318 family protein [bacterium RCC_150]